MKSNTITLFLLLPNLQVKIVLLQLLLHLNQLVLYFLSQFVYGCVRNR